MDGNVFPEALFTHCPLIRSLVALILTFGSITVVAVAIFNLLLCLINSTLRWLVSLGKPNPLVAEYHLAIARQPFAPRMSRRKEAYTPARIEASPATKPGRQARGRSTDCAVNKASHKAVHKKEDHLHDAYVL
jgi:hypothetical protein